MPAPHRPVRLAGVVATSALVALAASSATPLVSAAAAAAPDTGAAATAVAEAAFDEAGLPADPAAETKLVIVTETNGKREVTVRRVGDVDAASTAVESAMQSSKVVSVGVDAKVTAFTVVDQQDQWQMNPATYSYQAAWNSSTGAGITVAVIDSGVSRNHPDLPSSRVLTGIEYLGGNGQATASNGNNDQKGHGTFVAGVIAATKGNGQGIAGVAPDATILPIRTLNAAGSGYMSDATAGVYYAVANGAKVINMSLGGSTGFTPLQDAINYAVAHGVVVVASAGNSGPNTINYPAAYTNAIAVGAVQPGNTIASFSSYSTSSPYVDIVGPGTSITSTRSPLLSSYASNNYETGAGTSYSGPHVAAVAALLFAANPSLTASEVRAAIESTAGDLGASGTDPIYGAGYVRPAEALAAIGGPAPSGPFGFTATTPKRLYYNRPAANTTTTITVGGTNGIPSDATSVLARITAARSSKAGTASIYPMGNTSQAATVTLGRNAVTQTATVRLGIGGKMQLTTTQATQFTIDVLGYTAPVLDSASGQITNLSSSRILDTRTGSGVWSADPGDSKDCSSFGTWAQAHTWYWTYKALYGDVAHLDANNDGIVCETMWDAMRRKPATTMPTDLFKTTGTSKVELRVLGRGGVPASGVQAVRVTVTTLEAKRKGTMQALPSGTTSYGSWTDFDFLARTATSATYYVPVGGNGRITLNATAATHLTVDVVGYVTA